MKTNILLVYSVLRIFVIFPNTIFFRHTNELRNSALTKQQRKFFICSMEYGLLLEAARLVVFRLVGCLRRNGLAGCWDGSMLLDLWGMCLKSPCSFVSSFWRRVCNISMLLRAEFGGDMKWCLWKACWMFLIYVQLGFLVKNP